MFMFTINHKYELRLDKVFYIIAYQSISEKDADLDGKISFPFPRRDKWFSCLGVEWRSAIYRGRKLWKHRNKDARLEKVSKEKALNVYK